LTTTHQHTDASRESTSGRPSRGNHRANAAIGARQLLEAKLTIFEQPFRSVLAVADTLRACGFVLIQKWRPDLPTDELAASFTEIQDIAGISRVQVLTPKTRAESTPNVYSGNFGYGCFPLHTDLAHWFIPPRFVMLRCICGDNDVATSVLGWDALTSYLPPEAVQRARFRPRKPVRGRFHLLPFRQSLDGVELRRWDGLFLMPDNSDGARIASFLTGFQSEHLLTKIVLREPGDTLILDNWRTLHGRSDVSQSSQRVIERVYLQGFGDA
jgi:hypothetical protein